MLLAACGGGGGDGGSGTPPVNASPVANAGPDQTRTSGQTVTLAGGGTDSDGTIASFTWSQTAGPAVTLSSNTAQNPTFTAPTVATTTTLTFSLVVQDDDGAPSTADTVNINVNPPAGGGNVNVSGTITYQRVLHNTATSGLSYGNQRTDPARFVTVQAINNATQAVLAATATDNAGNYVLSVPPSTQMFIRIRAEMVKTGAAPTWDFRVVDNTAGNALYAPASAAFDSGTASQTLDLNAPSGFSSTGVANGARTAAPFAILDSVFVAFNKVLGADATAVFAPLVIGWSPNNSSAGGPTGTQACATNGHIGTSFYTDGNICILGSADNDTDEYDDHVLIHEWGHYFEDKFSRSDSVGGPHGGGDLLDLRVAFGEGWGNAWSGIASDDPVYRDSSGTNQAAGFFIDVEDNAVTNPGWFSEGSMQSILYDLYDSANEAPDAVALGFGPLYQVLRNTQRTGVPLTSIFPFITALKAANLGSAAGIDAIVNAQSINGTDAYGGNETNDASSANVLPVYTAYTVNAAAVNLCSIPTFGEYNKLSNRRFIRFSVTNPGVHTFTVIGGTDPDIYLHRAGVIGAGESAAAGSETFSQTLQAGDYVLEVVEFLNVDSNDATSTTSCFNVTIQR